MSSRNKVNQASVPKNTGPVASKNAGVVVTQNNQVPVKRVGTADLIGFGIDGVVVIRNRFRIEKKVVIKDFCFNKGWEVGKHPRVVGDTTGDGLPDIIGFGDEGVKVSVNKGDTTFHPPKLVIQKFGSDTDGWDNPDCLRFVADLRNKGVVDIIGFDSEGVQVSLNNGSGTFAPLIPGLDPQEFGSQAGGWSNTDHIRCLADTNGDGFLDIVGFCDSGVMVAISNGDGTFKQPGDPILKEFGYDQGWRVADHIRTLADITGDGRVDIVGFKDDGVWVALGQANGGFKDAKRALQEFGVDQGWKVGEHPRFIADIDGGRRGDIIGFKNDGVHVAKGLGGGSFSSPKLVLKAFGSDQGWNDGKRLRFLADLTGNGVVDIVGFGEEVVWVSYNDGSGNFADPVVLTDALATNNGWDMEKTVRFVANMF